RRLPEPVQIVCEQGKTEQLLTQRALHTLDVVLTEAPAGPATKIRAYNHLLGESGGSVMGSPRLAAAHRRGFPKSLDGAPFLLPGENTLLRRALEQWFEAEGIRPRIRGEFVDPALLKVFGQNGLGLFAVRTAVEKD